LNLRKRESEFFERLATQTNRSKWDADSTRYAHKFTAKVEPHCLILFRHGGFFFSRLAQVGDVNSALEHQVCRF